MDSSGQETRYEKLDGRIHYKPYGKLLLCLCKLTRDQNVSEYGWGKKDINLLKKCKNNIIQSHLSHYGSTGEYYSFGNRANFG